MKKHLLFMLLIFSVLIGLGYPATAMTSGEGLLFIDHPEAIVGDETFTLEVPPRTWDGTTLLPLRFVTENILQANITWEQDTHTITITKDSTFVQLRLNETQAIVNGKSILLTKAPIIEENRTLVPLRFLAETFGYEVHYDGSDKSILFRKALPPIAQFNLSQDTIVAGQNISAKEQSYDPYGYPIVDRIWQINNNPNLRSNTLISFFVNPPAGEYIIQLKVRNKAGVWSDWVEQSLLVEPNQPPMIRELRPLSSEVNQGEDLAFIYNADNEPWEEITDERWSYRNLDSGINGIGKPRALFSPGQYEISLQVRDAYGNWSESKSTNLHISERIVKHELEYKFTNPLPGELIDNPNQTNYNNLPWEYNYQIRTGGPTLILSNSPEAVSAPGILYRDKVSNAFRVMYHHKNSTSKVKNLIIVAENQGTEPVTLNQGKSAATGPVADVMHLGQLAAFNYLKAPLKTGTFIILPGEKLILYQSPNSGWKLGQSLTGMFDLESDGPLSITIAATGSSNNLLEMSYLPILDRDLHARGTFAQADRWVDIYLNPKSPHKIEIGKDRQGFEGWLLGYDALTGAPVVHKGNYGAVYHLTFHAKTRTGVFINPRGLTFKGAFQGFDGISYRAPSYDGFYGYRRAAVVGTLEPRESATIIYTPPNGSDAPVIFGLVPEAYWADQQ